MWSTFEIAGHSVDLFELPDDTSRSALIYLHDQDGETLRELAADDLLARNRLAAICPFGGPSWWSDRICAQFDRQRSVENWL
jgi:hypothetical protein